MHHVTGSAEWGAGTLSAFWIGLQASLLKFLRGVRNPETQEGGGHRKNSGFSENGDNGGRLDKSYFLACVYPGSQNHAFCKLGFTLRRKGAPPVQSVLVSSNSPVSGFSFLSAFFRVRFGIVDRLAGCSASAAAAAAPTTHPKRKGSCGLSTNTFSRA